MFNKKFFDRVEAPTLPSLVFDSVLMLMFSIVAIFVTIKSLIKHDYLVVALSTIFSAVFIIGFYANVDMIKRKIQYDKSKEKDNPEDITQNETINQDDDPISKD